MADGRRTPVVVLALHQLDEIALLPGDDHIRTAAGGLAKVSLLGSGLRDGLRGNQDRAVIAERWDKTERRLLEEDLDRGRVDRLGVVVGFGEETDRVDAFVLAPCVPDIEIGDDGGCIERRAIGEGHAALEMEREFGSLLVLLPAVCEPGTDLAIGVDIEELVGRHGPRCGPGSWRSRCCSESMCRRASSIRKVMSPPSRGLSAAWAGANPVVATRTAAAAADVVISSRRLEKESKVKRSVMKGPDGSSCCLCL